MVISVTYPNLFQRLRMFFAAFVESEDTKQHRQYKTIIREHSELIDRICFGYSRSQEDMEDLRQDALLNLWESMSAFKGQCSMKTWVYRLTLNSCVSALRKSYRRPSTVPLTELCDVIEDNQPLKLSELHEAISQLNPIDKAIVLLWLEEESYDEIAAIVGLTKSNVAVRIHRAKEKLKTILDR